MKCSQNSVVNIPTLGVIDKTRPVESFIIRGSQGLSIIPRQPRPPGATTQLFWKKKPCHIVKQKEVILVHITGKSGGGTKRGRLGPGAFTMSGFSQHPCDQV